MRVWDVSPGYLNRQSLLGEHRELHGLYVVLAEGRRGYSRHPETLRWVGCLSGLSCRHAALVAEMRLRGYGHRSPLAEAPESPLPESSRLPDMEGGIRWPGRFVTPPAEQYALLQAKYRERPPGRIPLPANVQALWAQHKYSVMARDSGLYRSLGPKVARMRTAEEFAALALDLALILREPPAPGRLANAVEHMWGYVAHAATADEGRQAHQSTAALLAGVAELAVRLREPYLLASTALSELAVFVGQN